MKPVTTLLAVAVGGAVGASLRYWLQLASARAFGPAFPVGTFAVNIGGCFAMGLLAAFLASREPDPGIVRAFLSVGLLGGFTTFSAFALDVVTLWRENALAAAALYLFGSVILSVSGLIAGLAAGRALW